MQLKIIKTNDGKRIFYFIPNNNSRVLLNYDFSEMYVIAISNDVNKYFINMSFLPLMYL